MPKVLITGANRGIGLEFVRQYSELNWEVIATCRNLDNAKELNKLVGKHPNMIKVYCLNVLIHKSIDDFSKLIHEEPIDLLINNAGVIGPTREEISGQSFGSMDYKIWEDVFRTNTIGPFKVTESLYKNLELGKQKKVVVISSTVGSNIEMKAPLFSYASSKASVTKTFTLLAEILSKKGFSVRIFCPGHVKTDMGGENANIEKETSVKGMVDQIGDLSLRNTGEFRRFNGERVEF
tara:strand:- start:112 stop:819 length:708 start_codon:yes stop_codon:yes gene_type:complete